MRPTRARIFLFSLAALLLCSAALVYFKYRRFAALVTDQAGAQASKRLGREVRLSGVSFSPLSGVIIRGACVSRRPDFSKGSFFCADRIMIRPRLGALLRNRFYLARVELDKPVIKLREENGRWDFEDLLALLPRTDKGLHLTWNTTELRLRNASVEADMGTSGLSLSVRNADLDLTHYSAFGGNYSVRASGLISTAAGGRLLSGAAKLDAEANFDYGGLSSTNGSFAATGVSYGAATLGSFNAAWKLFNIRRPLPEKNYSVDAAAADLLVPAHDSQTAGRIAGALRLLSRVTGRQLSFRSDFRAGSLKAAFSLKGSSLSLSGVSLRSDPLSLDAALTINGGARTAEAALDAALGGGRLNLSASGPLARPEIRPLLSSTLEAELRKGLAALENWLLRIFPVTGEQHV